MDIIPQWRIQRGVRIHAKWFGYPDERSKGNITGIEEYMVVNQSRLNPSTKIEEVEHVCTGSLSNN
jgi:hypothetical protein